MVKTNITQSQATQARIHDKMKRTPILSYDMCRLYSTLKSPGILSTHDLTRLTNKNMADEKTKTLIKRRFGLPADAVDSDYDSDETVANQ